MSAAPEPDFAHGSTADTNRLTKARTIAKWAHHHRVPVDALHGPTALPDATLRKIAREAHVNPPSTTETWEAAASALAVFTAWAVDHPDHPTTTQTDRPAWSIPDPVIPDDAPRGWAELVKLGPVDLASARCHECGNTPVVLTPAAAHCATHPPTGGQWGTGLNWTPKPTTGQCSPQPCYCGRCSHYPVARRHM